MPPAKCRVSRYPFCNVEVVVDERDFGLELEDRGLFFGVSSGEEISSEEDPDV